MAEKKKKTKKAKTTTGKKKKTKKKTAKKAPRPQPEAQETKTPFEKAVEGILETFQENLAVEFTRKLGEDVLEKAAETLMAQFLLRASEWVNETMKRVGEKATAFETDQKPEVDKADKADEAKDTEGGQPKVTQAWRQPVAELIEMVVTKFSLAFVGAVVKTMTGGDGEDEDKPSEGSA